MSEAVPFSDLVAQRAFLRNLARALVHDEHAAEDIAQDALLVALEARPSALLSPRAWLASVARRGALRWKRRENERPVREGRAARPASVEDRSDRDLALHQEVLEAVRALDPIYRSAIFLRFYEDRSPSLIAAELGLPVATVKTRLQRGLARLRDELDRKHDGQRSAWIVPLALVAAPSGLGVHASVTPIVTSALVLLMKKIVIAASALLALGLGFWVVRDSQLEGAPEPMQDVSLSTEVFETNAANRVARAETPVIPESPPLDAPKTQDSASSKQEHPAPSSDLRATTGIYGGAGVVTVLSHPNGDAWLNPTKRSFSPSELGQIQAFAMKNGEVASNLDQTFYQKVNELGSQLIGQGRYDGTADTSTLSAEEREKLPWPAQQDWMNPFIVQCDGPQRSWVQVDLRTEAPELARLREEGWKEITAARQRLREFIQSLPRN